MHQHQQQQYGRFGWRTGWWSAIWQRMNMRHSHKKSAGGEPTALEAEVETRIWKSRSPSSCIMAILVPPLAVSAQQHGRGTEGAEWPRSGRYQQDRVTVAICLPNIIPFVGTVAICLPNIIPFVGTARHLAEAMNRRSGDPQHHGSGSYR
jgi:hypothetical protein